MASTNQTPHYALPQYVATDKPTILGDVNDAFSKIDAQMYLNATSSSSASTDSASALKAAQQASTDAADAKTDAATAQSTADEAKTTAESASTTASTANDNATKALSTAQNNSIVLGDVKDTAEDAIKLSTNICDKYSVETAYNVGDYAIYEGKLYKCNTATTAGVFIPANWTAITTMGEMKRNKVTVDTALSATSTNPVTNKAVTEAIQNAGSSVTVDSALSSTSENPVQNKAIVTALAGKQDTLTIDSSLSDTSENPVQNKAIYTALAGKQDTLTIDSAISSSSTNPVQNKAIYTALAEKQDRINSGELGMSPVMIAREYTLKSPITINAPLTKGSLTNCSDIFSGSGKDAIADFSDDYISFIPVGIQLIFKDNSNTYACQMLCMSGYGVANIARVFGTYKSGDEETFFLTQGGVFVPSYNINTSIPLTRFSVYGFGFNFPN